MTQGPNRFLDEFAKLMTDAAGVADGFRKEAESAIRSQAERFMSEMDVVSKDDFEAVREMAANARTENDALKKQLEELEARVQKLEAGSKPSKSTIWLEKNRNFHKNLIHKTCVSKSRVQRISYGHLRSF